MVLISVIIPVYNAAPTLAKCIRSVLCQSLTDIEIIIINDGSTDESSNMIRSFANEDKRIVFVDGDNKGVSAARNIGLQIAKGEFIGFVDADDWIEPQMCKIMFEKLTEHNAELAICNVNIVKDDLVKKRLSLTNEVVNVKDNMAKVFASFMQFKYDYANWNKLYKRNIIEKLALRFNDKIHVGEDLAFNLMYLKEVNTLVTIDNVLYNYILAAEPVKQKNFNTHLHDFNNLFLAYKEFSDKYKIFEEWHVFREEMSRIFYYQLVKGVINSDRLKGISFLKKAKELNRVLKGFSPGIFSFPSTQLNGLNGFKKKLLMKGNYQLFSLLATFLKNK